MIQQGIPLHLVIHIYSLNNGICAPIRAVKVDIWHVNSQGIYSAVKDFGTTGQQAMMDLFTSPQFIQVGIRVEQFIFTSRSALLKDQIKLWIGPHSFTLIIISTNRYIPSSHIVNTGLPQLQTNKMESTQDHQQMA
jgi:hypothetical protein